MNDFLATITEKIAEQEKEIFNSFDLNNVSLSRKEKPLNILSQDKFLLIAECKKGSPSKGVILEEYHPAELAKEYVEGGASAISVITERNYFFGNNSHLAKVKKTVSVPVLKKDFIIHPYQVYEAYQSGADVVLLIVACLDEANLRELYDVIISFGMTPLVEVHNQEELTRALKLNPVLLGINNRDLKTFEVDIETSFRLKEFIPDTVKVISESGIRDSHDIQRLKGAGFYGALVGESILTSKNRTSKIQELMSEKTSFLKICGITNKEDFSSIALLEPEYFGFIFYEKSPRYILPKEVSGFLNRRVKRVGVFVDESIERIREIFYEAQLDIVQLHGDETPQFCLELGLPFWKAIRVKDEESLAIIEDFPKDTIFLLDAFSESNYGGTGKEIEFSLLEKALIKTKNIIIAGGIGINNIERIMALSPLGVDISSSAEVSPGRKDVVKCRELIKLVNKIREKE